MSYAQFEQVVRSQGAKIKYVQKKESGNENDSIHNLLKRLIHVKVKSPSDKAAKAVSEGLVKLPNLRSSLFIDCSGHKTISAKGAQYFSDALKSTSRLLALSLSGHNLGSDGAWNLASALKKNNTLTYLDVSRNGISDEGAGHLADALKTNRGLVHLNMSDNDLQRLGAEYMAEALEENETLFYLEILGKIEAEGIRRLVSALETNTTLASLTLTIPFGNEELGSTLNVLLAQNALKRKEKFDETLLSDETTSWSRSRVMFVGQGRAGKSATVRSLLGQEFVENLDSTVGAFVSESESTDRDVKWEATSKAPGDHATKFAARILADKAKNGSNEPRKNKSKRKTLVEFGRSIRNLAASFGTRAANPDAVIEINAGDNAEEAIEVDPAADAAPAPRRREINGVRVVEEENGEIWQEFQPEEIGTVPAEEEEQEIVREYHEGMLNDADSLMLSLWDFGGQEVFYSMHHIFLTKSGVYVLVCDLRKLRNENSRDEAVRYLSFWLNSIKLHAKDAPVIIAGTFSSEIEAEKEMNTINSVVSNLVKGSFPNVVLDKQNGTCFFPIDNSDLDGVLELRTSLEKVIYQDRAVNQQVSMKWMVFLDEILSHRSKHSYLELQTVYEIAKEKCNIEKAGVVDQALQLFHDRGMIVHLTATETLRNIIIIKPQWLIDQLSKVIRDETLHGYDQAEFENAGLKNDLRLMYDESLASAEFLSYVWEMDQVDFLIDLMQKTMLLSVWTYSEEKQYLIPSLLKKKYEGEPTGLRCKFDFSDSFLPNGVFQRLICISIAHCAEYSMKNGGIQVGKPELYKNYGRFEFEPESYLGFHEDAESRSISVFVENQKSAMKSLGKIIAMLRKLNYDVMHGGLEWKTFVEDAGSGKMLPYKTALKKGLQPWFEKPKKDVNVVASENVDLSSFLTSLSAL